MVYSSKMVRCSFREYSVSDVTPYCTEQLGFYRAQQYGFQTTKLLAIKGFSFFRQGHFRVSFANKLPDHNLDKICQE